MKSNNLKIKYQASCSSYSTNLLNQINTGNNLIVNETECSCKKENLSSTNKK